MPPSPLASQNVAVIGAGAAGLVAARELRREGHRVVVFERQPQLGGTWVYTPRVESDPIGLDPNREIVHSSLYPSLRTNLPREVMGFRDFPFVATGRPGRDSRRYPGHEEVLSYLQDFTHNFKLNELVRYHTEVKRVELDHGKMKVRSTAKGGSKIEEDGEIFDAVVVCNGHYSEPRIAQIPGVERWPGRQIHSHNYRLPDLFKNQTVVLIGSANSAADISLELAGVAKEVHISSRSAPKDAFGKQPGYHNIWLHPVVASAKEDGTVSFDDGSTILADVILHCTGYHYKFPFLSVNDAVTVDDNCVAPLYKHVFPPSLAPMLSFVGLPLKVIPFPQCELQSKWIAGVLSGRISLPSVRSMMEDIESFYAKLDDIGAPKSYTHRVGEQQFEYNDWLAAQCGRAPTEEWRRKMNLARSNMRKARPDTYRDEWVDDNLVLEAHKDFTEYL